MIFLRSYYGERRIETAGIRTKKDKERERRKMKSQSGLFFSHPYFVFYLNHQLIFNSTELFYAGFSMHLVTIAENP